jgi:hypothetical protein
MPPLLPQKGGKPSRLLETMRIPDVEISEKGEAFVERAYTALAPEVAP